MGKYMPKRIPGEASLKSRPRYSGTAATGILASFQSGRGHLAQPAQPGEGFGGDGLIVGGFGFHQYLHERFKSRVTLLSDQIPDQPGAQMGCHLFVSLAFFMTKSQDLHQTGVHNQGGQALGYIDVLLGVPSAFVPRILRPLLFQCLSSHDQPSTPLLSTTVPTTRPRPVVASPPICNSLP